MRVWTKKDDSQRKHRLIVLNQLLDASALQLTRAATMSCLRKLGCLYIMLQELCNLINHTQPLHTISELRLILLAYTHTIITSALEDATLYNFICEAPLCKLMPRRRLTKSLIFALTMCKTFCYIMGCTWPSKISRNDAFSFTESRGFTHKNLRERAISPRGITRQLYSAVQSVYWVRKLSSVRFRIL